MKKIFPPLVSMMALASIALCQEKDSPQDEKEEKPPTEEEIYRDFSVGTFLGTRPGTPKLMQVFGPQKSMASNRFFANQPAMLFEGNDNYVFEVGADNEGAVAYVLVAKKTRAHPSTINVLEARGLLYKVAGGGTWDMVDDGKEEPAKEGGAERRKRIGLKDDGVFWEYKRTYKGNVQRFFAYLRPSEIELLIYSPKVSVDLGGNNRSFRRAIAFQDGTEFEWVAGEAGAPTIYTFVDTETPVALAAAEKSNDADAVATALSQSLEDSLKSGKQLSFNDKDYRSFVAARTLLATANDGKQFDLTKVRTFPFNSLEVKGILDENKGAPEKAFGDLKKLESDLKKEAILPRW